MKSGTITQNSQVPAQRERGREGGREAGGCLRALCVVCSGAVGPRQDGQLQACAGAVDSLQAHPRQQGKHSATHTHTQTEDVAVICHLCRWSPARRPRLPCALLSRRSSSRETTSGRSACHCHTQDQKAFVMTPQRALTVVCVCVQGMVLLDRSTVPKATWEFEAEVVILHHATTIKERCAHTDTDAHPHTHTFTHTREGWTNLCAGTRR